MHFNYTGVALPEPGRIVNDIKEVNGHFLMGMHANGPTVYSTASKGNADTFPPSTPLFSHFSGDDKYIVSLGFVVDGDGGATRNATRVLGALYGAGAIHALDNNRVFAAWLQRHVLFEVRRGRGGAQVRRISMCSGNVCMWARVRVLVLVRVLVGSYVR